MIAQCIGVCAQPAAAARLQRKQDETPNKTLGDWMLCSNARSATSLALATCEHTTHIEAAADVGEAAAAVRPRVQRLLQAGSHNPPHFQVLSLPFVARLRADETENRPAPLQVAPPHGKKRESSGEMEDEEFKPPPPETEQVRAIKRKIRDAFSVFDREGRNACDVREVGTIVRSLNIYPTEKQLQRWIHEMEEEEPTGLIFYEKVYAAAAPRAATVGPNDHLAANCGTAAALPSQPAAWDRRCHPCTTPILAAVYHTYT